MKKVMGYELSVKLTPAVWHINLWKTIIQASEYLIKYLLLSFFVYEDRSCVCCIFLYSLCCYKGNITKDGTDAIGLSLIVSK